MSPCCGKIPDDNDTSHIRDSIENGGPSSSEIASVRDTLAEVQSSQPDLSVSNSQNPFADEIASVKNNHDWWTVKGNHIIAFRDSDGQMNLDIVAGPDRGVHRYYDPLNMREGQTGVENPKDGSRRHDKG